MNRIIVDFINGSIPHLVFFSICALIWLFVQMFRYLKKWFGGSDFYDYDYRKKQREKHKNKKS